MAVGNKWYRCTTAYDSKHTLTDCGVKAEKYSDWRMDQTEWNANEMQNKYTDLVRKRWPVPIRENIAQITNFLFHMAILFASRKSFFRSLVFVVTVRIRNTSLCGHIIKEGITVILLRMLALHQFVCFYSDVLLKRAQSEKQNIKKKRSTIVSGSLDKEYDAFMSRKCLWISIFTKSGLQFWVHTRIRFNICNIFKLLITFSKIFRYSW